MARTEMVLPLLTELFDDAIANGCAGIACKTKPVDALPAGVGATVTPGIKGDGIEMVSEPAPTGEMAVRNRCP